MVTIYKEYCLVTSRQNARQSLL